LKNSLKISHVARNSTHCHTKRTSKRGVLGRFITWADVIIKNPASRDFSFLKIFKKKIFQQQSSNNGATIKNFQKRMKF
jgi:hypothetical protein